MKLSGVDDVVRALQQAQEDVIQAAMKGLLRAGLLLEARGKALAAVDTHNLENSIAADQAVKRTAESLSIQVTCLATSGAGVSKTGGEPGEVYSEKVHENMEYDGPNVGGSRTQARGEATIRKGVSVVEPTDGTAGGKFLERPLRNKPEKYTELITEAVSEALA